MDALAPHRPRQPVRRHRVLRSLQRRGIKPIIGVEAYVAPRRMTDRAARSDKSGYHLILLAQRRRGLPQPAGADDRRPTSRATTTSRASTGTCSPSSRGADRDLSACLGGEVARADPRRRLRRRPARRRCWYRDVFGAENYFIELQDHGLGRPAGDHAGRARAQPRARDPAGRHQRHPLRPPEGRRRRRTSCSASRPTAPSTTRSGCACETPEVLPQEPPTRWPRLFAELPEALATRSPSPSAAT